MTLPDGWKRVDIGCGITAIENGAFSVWHAKSEDSIAVYLEESGDSADIPPSVMLAILDDNNLNETANELREKLRRTEKMLEFAKLKIANIWGDEFGGTVDDNLARVSVMIGRNVP